MCVFCFTKHGNRTTALAWQHLRQPLGAGRAVRGRGSRGHSAPRGRGHWLPPARPSLRRRGSDKGRPAVPEPAVPEPPVPTSSGKLGERKTHLERKYCERRCRPRARPSPCLLPKWPPNRHRGRGRCAAGTLIPRVAPSSSFTTETRTTKAPFRDAGTGFQRILTV